MPQFSLQRYKINEELSMKNEEFFPYFVNFFTPNS